jgi:hypothetical protein
MNWSTETKSIYDFFGSYAHNDNHDNWITEFIDAIEREHLQYTPQRYKIFFDHSEIRTMDDWEHRILAGLRSSKAMFAMLSPEYFESEYCYKEWQIYLEHELDKSISGEGIAPIYIETALSFDQNSDLENNNKANNNNSWPKNLFRRQYIDFRPWRSGRPSSLQDPKFYILIKKLEEDIFSKITKVEKILSSPTNLPRNSSFVGRLDELRLLREILALRRVGAIALVQGMGGSGKSALAFEYGHQFAHEYPGGRFVINCSGISDLRDAMVKLEYLMNINFTLEEKRIMNVVYLGYVPSWKADLLYFCYWKM